MSEMMIKAVTFDLWHTVLEEPMKNFGEFLRKNRAKAMEEVFEEHGLPQPLEDLERAYDVQGQRLWDIWSRGLDIDQRAQIGIVLSELKIRADRADDALVEKLVRVYNEVLALVPPVPFDGAKELLGKLKDMGQSLAIISNTGRTGGKFFRGLMEGYGLAQYFDVTEDKGLILHDGTTQGKAELVAYEVWNLAPCKRILWINIKEITSIQGRVAVIVIDGSMQIVGARFGDGGDDSARKIAVLSAEGTGDDLEFFDRFYAGH